MNLPKITIKSVGWVTWLLGASLVFQMCSFSPLSQSVQADSLISSKQAKSPSLPKKAYVNKETGIHLTSVQTAGKTRLIKDSAMNRYFYQPKSGNRQLIHGLCAVDGNLYDFLGSWGELATAQFVVNNKQVYYFGYDHRALFAFPYQAVFPHYLGYTKTYLLKNKKLPKAGLYLINKKAVYLNANGEKLYQGKVAFKQFLYFVQPNSGALIIKRAPAGQWVLAKTGSKPATRKTAYLIKKKKATGLVAIGGQAYYFNKQGRLLKNATCHYHDYELTFDKNGHLSAFLKEKLPVASQSVKK